MVLSIGPFSQPPFPPKFWGALLNPPPPTSPVYCPPGTALSPSLVIDGRGQDVGVMQALVLVVRAHPGGPDCDDLDVVGETAVAEVAQAALRLHEGDHDVSP